MAVAMGGGGGIYVGQGVGAQVCTGGSIANTFGDDDSFTTVMHVPPKQHRVEFAADGGLVQLAVGDRTFEATECKLQVEIELPDGQKLYVPYHGTVSVTSKSATKLSITAVNGPLTATVHGDADLIEARNGSVKATAEGRISSVTAHNGSVHITGSVNHARASMGDVIVHESALPGCVLRRMPR